MKIKPKDKCFLCHKKLGIRNESGYCSKCYIKCPQFLEYQREFSKDSYYNNPKRKKWIKDYKNDPKVKNKIKNYQKEYQNSPENLEKIREHKREWARKNRIKKNKKKSMNIRPNLEKVIRIRLH